ncbi:hypothetical protein PsorP6_001294 [Peronosclerospora sorghi]|uniref:Uncharacterized protein n=1 Tax=Peronosclerospora sorghi TaxID=230839 RepID=A0ACC0WT16_9STRA|nr:hypothetical protein PsorP6_001294 [Peronosclerospora sorghi]
MGAVDRVFRRLLGLLPFDRGKNCENKAKDFRCIANIYWRYNEVGKQLSCKGETSRLPISDSRKCGANQTSFTDLSTSPSLWAFVAFDFFRFLFSISRWGCSNPELKP